MAGLIPLWLTGWKVEHTIWAPLRLAGATLAVVGAVALLEAFARFVSEGLGTPAPIAPTQTLVIGGPYRHVRNPMYLAVAAVIVGQALVLGQARLLIYAGAYGIAVGSFVRWYEEPTLSRRFGRQYEAYRSGVPAWRPRLRPWRPQSEE
ncbi:MAG: hypothetical protein V7607_1721 [Solirubrobacteraceae bacterium]